MPPTRRQQVLGYQAAVAAVRGRLLTYADLVWRGLGTYREADIDRLVDLIVPKVLAGQRHIAGLTDAYIAAVAGRASIGVDATAVTVLALRGVDPAEVYLRPGKTVWGALAKGTVVDRAVAQGGRRLQSLVATDLQMARVSQQRTTMLHTGVQSYRRVLTGEEDCGMCQLAATRAYHSADLLPIHPGCDCGCEPADEASIAGDLNAAHPPATNLLTEVARLGSDPAAPPADLAHLVAVREHGEYGPTLAWAPDQFTGPGDL